MKPFLSLCLCALLLPLPSEASEDWHAWRGPNGNGIAASDQNPPTHWGGSENVLWKTPIPGRGHGSPTVVGDFIYLAIADQGSQSILCLNRATGVPIWTTVVHEGKLNRGGHQRTTQASSTITHDGERLIVNFLNDDAVHTTALNLKGKRLWQTKISDFVTHQGFGSSPLLCGPLVIVSADNRGGGAVVALERKTGKEIWRQARPAKDNYTSPALLHANGRDQVVLTGCDIISSYDPLTGIKLWEIEGATTECVATMVTDGERVFSSGGWPKNHITAVVADGSGRIAWKNSSRVYVPSMIVRDGHLYAVMDGGFASCWKSDTGEELWKERLGGEFFASPVMVGEHIYAINVRGKTFVFEATPKAFKLISTGQLGDEAYATPVICESRIYQRVAHHDDERQEMLYCIGE